ncbi:heterokaryon incompatibility protein-domain-containing protein [Paraphoma chrysanthemicola]|uniref:Heterokaryon incompatibility protein-domain-containing protein n=1 Tax=Paraphoma chrysanthemicola TaxID=798071 RepID=A0A8K0REN9_9PLEO|nr:heterokaryon incompatibility protein-domain-containing protein [Paraphoma chrysanthemicola]
MRCKSVHGTQCDRRNLPERYSNPIDIILVDVLHECLVQKTTASRYFALSYVWGGAVTVTTTTQNLSVLQQVGSLGDMKTLPPTVADAIVLTRKMGEQYLWVDCLSIIQDSPTKHQDIKNMDVIFSQAELTIVTTCGDDATAALAGVRPNTRRRRTMSKQHGNCLLTLYLPTSKYGALNCTTYDSRGWTFQEVLLSKRILLVSPQQLVFYCSRSRRSESIPMERPYSNDFGWGEINLFPKSNNVSCDMAMLASYSTVVKEYSGKCLSFQSDIENAFAGLASIFEGWYEGSPVVHGYILACFAWSMMWMFDPGSHRKRSLSEVELGRKRSGFPTWSWVAWHAIVTSLGQRNLAMMLPVLSRVRNVEITLFNEQEHSCSWDIVDTTSTDHHAKSSCQRIHIELNPKGQSVSSVPLSLLAFDAEYTCWHYYFAEPSSLYVGSLKLELPGITRFCGILSAPPNLEFINAALDRSANAGESGKEWRLVRLYQFQLNPWTGVIDGIQFMLQTIQDESDSSLSAEAFREAFEKSELLFVLLVRRQGAFWERMGSGIMMEEYWPSIDGPESFRSYQDRIVLI